MLTLHPLLSFRQRLLGVHGIGPLGADQGVWIHPCAAIHTLCMPCPLDVMFLDTRDQPLRVCHALPPNRWAWCWQAQSVVELPAGYCRRHPDAMDQITAQIAGIRQATGLAGGFRRRPAGWRRTR